MTTAFAVGDKVEFIETYKSSRDIAIGEAGVVTKGGGSYDLVRVTLDKDGKSAECFGKRLKLVPATTFKVGDKVRNTGAGNYSWKGVEGVAVNEITPGWDNNRRWTVRITAIPSGFTFHSVGTEVTMTHKNLELVEAPAPAKRELQEGDKVRVATSGNPDWDGIAEGIITERREKSNKVKLTKAPNDFYYKVGDIANLKTDHLVVIDNFPRPITFKEIQKGDTIRRTLVKDNGSKVIREAVAENFSTYSVYDTGHETSVANHDDDTNQTVTLELLARPVKEPEIWENRKVGDQISVDRNSSSHTRIFTKVDDDKWDTLLVDCTGRASNGFTRGDAAVAGLLKSWKEDRKITLHTK